jgi:tRNA threonylcarbamoyladenosine biosynthesis protein TsaB
MIVLAIETSTALAGVALWRQDALVAQSVIRGPRELAARLAPAIEALLAEAGARVDDVEGVAVDHGPGSFTGLRVGVGTAKMLAHARGLPVVGVSSLEAAAWRARELSGGLICPVLSSHREQLYAAAYRTVNGRLEPVLEESATDGPSLVAQLNPLGEPVRYCAQAADLPRAWLTRGLRAIAEFLPSASTLPSAEAVAGLGAPQLVRGEDDGALALPARYLRKSSAELDAGAGAGR